MKQLATLAFFASNPGWQSFHKSMTKQVKRLEQLRFLEVNEFQMARFTGKVYQ
jgi:hypothetical protein